MQSIRLYKRDNKMYIREFRKKLIEICQSYGAYKGSTKIVVDTPYIPYIPDNWNGVLVLAEAQNLSIDDYKDFEELKKICRLYPDQDDSKNYDDSCPYSNLQIQPWQDGSIPLALKAALNLDPYQTAVCNACLWSLRENGKNVNPNDEMQRLSRALWQEMWKELCGDIKRVICCGSIAKSIFNFAEPDCLRLSSPNALSRVSGMFTEEDLFERYPEVKEVFAHFKDSAYRRNKIFYACHAVSILKKGKD